VEVYLVAIGSLGRAERMSQCRMSRSMTVTAWREGKKEDCSSYRDCKLFLSEDRLEVVRVDCGIASIPLFRIDVPSSSESI